MTIKSVRKRDNRVVQFDESKIADAIYKAACVVGGSDRAMADELAAVVMMFLEKNYESEIPGIEDIQDLVEKVLIETGHAKTAKAYILYRDRRSRIREQMRVRKTTASKGDTTDMSLLVDAGSHDLIQSWDKGKVAEALVKEADIEQPLAEEIARSVEEKIFASGIRRISTSLIRELVDNELFTRGLSNRLEMQSVVGMPRYDLQQLIYSKSKENSNITANNPEAINLAIAETTLKQFALKEVFSRDVSDAHRKGMIHLHDLGYPTRVYCSSHSLEYLKKYGLSLGNLDTQSAPAKHARTLTGHLNTFLASMQAYYAGALGIGYINILYAPYLEGLDYKRMRQEAQHLIFSGSQSAFSRGGQTLFLDFNVHTGVPNYMKDTPAIGPGGKLTGKTYGEYEKIAQDFCCALLDVWSAGDANHHVFAFPKCDLHVSEDTFKDPAQRAVLDHACKVAGENGSPYFVFDRDEVTLAACCRLRTKITDNYMIKNLESMRFCGFQNVSVNLPQAAYRAGRNNVQALLKEIDRAIDLAVKAHLQKKTFISHLMSAPNMPLWEIGKKARDGRVYVDLEKATYILGLVGLNECVQYLSGEELHDSDEALRLGLKIVSHMYFRAKEAGKTYDLKFSLEESPAESAARRLAKVDLALFPQAAEVMRGDQDADEAYYTNSIHLRADAPVDLLTRIVKQAKFHTMIESGAIIHAFVGEHLPPAESVFALVEKTFFKTKAAQLTISPEFTICNNCQKMEPGIAEECPWCHSDDVYGLTRIVGYFSRIKNWNKSKLGELKDRQAGNYHVTKTAAAEKQDTRETVAMGGD